MARGGGFRIEVAVIDRTALVGAFVEAAAAAQSRKAAYASLNKARELVHVKSGALKNSLAVTRHGKGEYELSAGDDIVDYAAAVEFGTYKMPAKPYFTPAMEEGRKIMQSAPEGKLK